MITLGSKTWGSAPEIKITFAYEKQRSGADMLYRTKVTVASVTGSSYFGYPIYLKLTIGGVKRVTKTLKSASPSQWSSAITYTSDWYTVEDKTSGTTPVSFNIYSGSGSSRNSTYTYSMEVDPGSSGITVGNGTLGTAQTLSVTRYDDSFTHTITYECGTASGTICEKSEAESISFTPPLSLASQNVTDTIVSVTFKINTYSGTAAVGATVEKTVTMAIPASVKPECEIDVSDPMGYADTFGGFVQGRSKMEISVSATLAYGSAIQSKKIVADGKTYTKDSITPVIASGENLTISATVTDGRKRTSDTATKPVTVLPYAAPVISLLSVHRCDSDGTENITGSYAKVTYSFAITSLSSKNAKVITLYYKKSADSDYTPVTLPSAYSATSATYIFAADDGSSYDVELYVYDTFTASEPIKKTTSISTADCLMHWRSDGTGIAFGKVSEIANAYEFGKPIYDKFGTLMGNGLAAYSGGGDDGIDPDTTLEELCLTSHSNAPQGLGTFYYIHTAFYNTKAENAARTQVAFPYNKVGSIYYRYYASGAWSAWQRLTADADFNITHGTEDPDTTKKRLILTNTNTPMGTGYYMYIQTMFNGDPTSATYRSQIAVPYNRIGSVYHRCYTGSSWTAWRRHLNEDESYTQITKLWENASPTSTFAAQTVALNLSGYDGVMVTFKALYNGTDIRMTTGFIPLGIKGVGMLTHGDADSIRKRNFIATESGVEFETGYKVAGNSSGVGHAIPTAIYGIKGVT